MNLRRTNTVYFPKRTFMSGVVTTDHIVLGYAHGTIVSVRRRDSLVAWDMSAKRWQPRAMIEGILVLEDDYHEILRGVDPETGATRWLGEGNPHVESGRLYAYRDSNLDQLDPASGRIVETWTLPSAYGVVREGVVLMTGGATLSVYDLDARACLWRVPALDSLGHGGRGLWRACGLVVEQAGTTFRGIDLCAGTTRWTWVAPENVGQASCVAGRILMHMGSQLVALDAHTGEIAWLRDHDEIGSPFQPPNVEWSGWGE